MERMFEDVLFIGPDIKGKGGISSVLYEYSKILMPFYYLPSNSRRGTIAGAFVLLKLVLLLPYYCFVKKIKIVHVHGASRKSFVRKRFIMRYAKLLGRKVIFHCHSAEFESYVAEVGKERIVAALSKCDSIVVLSQKWADYFEKHLKLSNVGIVNNIVVPIAGAGKGHRLRENVIKMLFLGAIGVRKGVFDLLDVIVKHKEEFEDKIKLIIGGNGEVERLKKLISREQLEGIVEYVGWVTGEDKSRLLQECDIVVLPSYNEGLPIVLLEAMANAKPSITTNVGGIPEVVKTGENGVVILPGDKEALYEAIRLFMDNPQLIAEYGNEGHKRVKNFYPQSVKNQLENLYKQL